MRSGTADAPGWVLILEAAREWGTPPWNITGGSTILWFERWKAFREASINNARSND